MADQDRIKTIIEADKAHRRKHRYWYTTIVTAMTLREAKKEELRE